MSAAPVRARPGVADEPVWRDLCARHGPHFTETLHVPGLLTDVPALSAGLTRALRAATRQDGDELARLRIYRDSMLDYRSIETALHTPWARGSLEEWFDGVAHGGSICAAFNEVDRWDAALGSRLAADLVEPMAERFGPLGTNAEWYSFIGRDGWTPFGLHRDPEVSMIFHLGPAPKEVWVWDPDVLPALPGGRQLTYDYDHLLPGARHIVMQPGDFVSIPAGHFHIFRNVGFAAFLGLMVFPQDRTRLLGQAVADMAAEDGTDATSWRPAPEGHDEVVARLAALTAADLPGRAARLLRRRELLRRSAGYSGKPFVLAPVPALKGETVMHPYGGALQPGPDDAVIAVRGRLVRLPRELSASEVVETLQSRPPSTVGEIAGLAVFARLDRSAVLGLLAALVSCGGLRAEHPGEADAHGPA